MNKQYEMVREFHKAFNQEMPVKPAFLSNTSEAELGYSAPLVNYAAELKAICKQMKEASNVVGGMVMKRASWMLEELVEFMEADTLDQQVDAMADELYFTIGTLTLMGVKPEEIFTIVHESNMGKLHEDGKPRFDDQGKIIKPEGWAERYAPEPRIVEELARQTAAAEITDAQRDLMIHALGLNDRDESWRNYFYDDQDDPHWNDLVAKGYATKRPGWDEKSAYFLVTDEGKKILGLGRGV